MTDLPIPRGTRARLVTVAGAAAISLLVAACGGAAPTASPVPPAASASPAPSARPADSAQSAVDAVRARVPLLDGFGPKDPDLIGQATFWTATSTSAGWEVTFETGWGDCQAGCIDRHTWSWTVKRDGSIAFVAEAGSALPEDTLAALKASSTRTGVAGRATGGPTCPVERPNDPACAPRLVAGAALVVRDGTGKEVARVTTDGSGYFRLALAPGSYTLEAPQVEGFVSAMAPTPFTVQQGAEAWMDVAYETGLR
jgi:hypothetical protein